MRHLHDVSSFESGRRTGSIDVGSNYRNIAGSHNLGHTKYVRHQDIGDGKLCSGKSLTLRQYSLQRSPATCFAQDDLYTLNWGAIQSIDLSP
jgi:hypothetical protein